VKRPHVRLGHRSQDVRLKLGIGWMRNPIHDDIIYALYGTYKQFLTIMFQTYGPL
jgi:hypothetical protein